MLSDKITGKAQVSKPGHKQLKSHSSCQSYFHIIPTLSGTIKIKRAREAYFPIGGSLSATGNDSFGRVQPTFQLLLLVLLAFNSLKIEEDDILPCQLDILILSFYHLISNLLFMLYIFLMLVVVVVFEGGYVIFIILFYFIYYRA